MNEKNLVICDREIRYANSLATNITNEANWAVKVCVCSSIEHVFNFMKDHQIHILIVDESYLYSERQQIMADQTYVLCKDRVIDLGTEEKEILKYRCADDIIREIFEIYTEYMDDNLMLLGRKRGTRLIAVYSPIHRIGKTSFAIALGKEYAKCKETLYLNLEEYPSFEGLEQGGMGLGDLLYYTKQGSGNIASKLRAGVKKIDGLAYLSPISVLRDLKETSAEEWRALLDEIMNNSAYERIILDIGDSIQGLFQILEMCNRVYMPILSDAASERKIQCYDRNVAHLKMERLARVTHRFVVPDSMETYARLRVKEEG